MKVILADQLNELKDLPLNDNAVIQLMKQVDPVTKCEWKGISIYCVNKKYYDQYGDLEYSVLQYRISNKNLFAIITIRNNYHLNPNDDVRSDFLVIKEKSLQSNSGLYTFISVDEEMAKPVAGFRVEVSNPLTFADFKPINIAELLGLAER